MRQSTILVVDDDSAILRSFAAGLCERGLAVTTAESADDYLLKPVASEELLLYLEQHLGRQRQRCKLRLRENMLTVCAYCRKVCNDTASQAVATRGCAVLDITAEEEEGGRYSIFFGLTLSGNGLDARQEQQLLEGHEAADDESSPSALLEARAICRRYGGNVLVNNSIGYGTRFLMKICLADGAEDDEADGR